MKSKQLIYFNHVVLVLFCSITTGFISSNQSFAGPPLSGGWTVSGTHNWEDSSSWVGNVVPDSNTNTSIDVDGATAILSTSSPGGATLNFKIGMFNTATLKIINGGVLTTNGSGLLGETSGTGTVEIDGAGSHWSSAGGVTVGFMGIGILKVSNGGKLTASGGAGSIVLNAGDGSDGGQLIIGAGGTAPGVVEAAEVTDGGGGVNAGASALVFEHNQTATPYVFSPNVSASIFHNGVGTTQIAGTISNRPGDGFNYVGVSQGILILSGNNTYAGGTTVNAGATLIVSNVTGSGTGTSLVQVNSGATLAGTGTINGDTTINGILASGDSSDGISDGLTFNSNLTLAGPSTTTIFTISAGANYDNIIVNSANSLTLNGTIKIVLNGYTPNMGDTFDFFDFNTANLQNNGVVFDFSQAQLDPGLSWNTSNFSIDGTISVIPEPSTWALMAIGFIGTGGILAFRRWRLQVA